MQNNILDSDNQTELINDCIKEIKKYKLEESKKEIMSQIKQYEEKGLFEESLQLVKEFQNVEKEIMKLTSNERR